MGDRIARTMTTLCLLVVLLTLPLVGQAGELLTPPPPAALQEAKTQLVPIKPATIEPARGPVVHRAAYGGPYYGQPNTCQPNTCQPSYPATCCPVPQPPNIEPPAPPLPVVNVDDLKREICEHLAGELRRQLARLPKAPTAEQVAEVANGLRPDYIDVRHRDEWTGEEATRRVYLGRRFTIHHHPPELQTRPGPGT